MPPTQYTLFTPTPTKPTGIIARMPVKRERRQPAASIDRQAEAASVILAEPERYDGIMREWALMIMNKCVR